MRERFTGADRRFLVACAAVAALSLFVVFNWFTAAFPEASIDFRYDRDASTKIAEPLAASALDVRGMKHTATFDDDTQARIFLERQLGLKGANALMKRDVHVWWWHHRWFRPLQEEEVGIDIAPTGEVVAFSHHIPEATAIATSPIAGARAIAEAFLGRIRVNAAALQLVTQSERNLPHRVQRIFTWESRSQHPAGAPYRFVVAVDGNVVTGYSQRLKVPDDWQRSYRELRSKNFLAGNVDLIFFGATVIAALVIFIVRLRRGDLRVKFLLGIGAAAIVLTIGVAINSFPSAVAEYQTTTSYAAFLAEFVFLRAILPALGTAMLLIVLAGSGEVLYRERFPQHLALPKIWTWRALESRRVFRSFVLAYTLVAFFLGYQVAFYLIADKLGAWAPAEIPYDEILNSGLPWVAVLFAGFFPALSEELISRAFSIPFFEKIFHSRIAAIVIAGFIWGFGHATYPNQPFFIRGVEVGCAGVLLGFLLFRFGLLPLLIWHYTVDALYTALLLLRSGNRYYIVSGALSSLVFAVPMLISLALYFRNGGFASDEDLSNATISTSPPRPAPEHVEELALPPLLAFSRGRVIACVLAIAVAALLIARRPPSTDDATDVAIPREAAKRIALDHLHAAGTAAIPPRAIAVPVDGFRSWDRDSPREDGGAPGGFDGIAAEYIVHRSGSIARLVEIFRTKVRTGTWSVRFFAPLQKREFFVEIDPRSSRVVGDHEIVEERAPGPRLDQPQALAIATHEMPRCFADPNAFDLKEALAFQQPNRRDWLFHFQERQPLAGDAFRRVSVRVAGDRVTQCTQTVKVPDAVYREANRTTLLNVILFVLKIIGIVAMLSFVVAGFVIATRPGRFPWRRPLRWTLILAIFPIAGALANPDAELFSYNTSTGWDTFLTNLTIDAGRTTVLQLALIFLSLVAIEAVYPFVPALLTRAGRARFGRTGVAGALTALGVVVAVRTALRIIAQYFPQALSISPPALPGSLAISWAAPLDAGQALIHAVEASAVVALFALTMRSMNRRWLPPLLTILTVFFIALDASVRMPEVPLAIAAALTAAILAWVVPRYVIRDNLLAYPAAAFIATLAQSASTLLQNHRPDLRVNGIAEVVVIAAVVLWLATVRPDRTTTN